MQTELLNLAIIGVGEHARRNILPAISGCTTLRLRGLFTRNADVRRAQAEALDVTPYPSIDALLGDDAVDVVCIAVPTGLHAEIAHRCLEAGKHVFCEKSLTPTAEETEALLDAARGAGRGLFECFNFPHHAQFQELQRILTSGELGELRCITARFGFPHLAPDNVRYRQELGGGALLDAGCYAVCAARLLLPGKISQVYGILDQEDGYEVDTSGSALLGDDRGTVAQLSWGFGRAYRNEIELWGSEASLRVERAFSKPPTLATSIAIRDTRGAQRSVEIPPQNHFTAMFDRFATAIADDAYEPFAADARSQAALLGRLFQGSQFHTQQ